MNKLLTREDFRETVFARDGGYCVFCGKDAVDAHHILDRKLWPDGGYYLDNGASVCEKCHIDCEHSAITVEECRNACGIANVIVPPQLNVDQEYDKWGVPTTRWIKYPHTWYLPWCSTPSREDRGRIHKDLSFLEGQRVIVTEKMDGENTSMYSDHIHARSLDSRHHSSRDWVKLYWALRQYEIPEGWRICGENVYARHSIAYDELQSYFLGFSIWNDRNDCLSWDDTLEWFKLLDVDPVPVLYDGVYDEEKVRALEPDPTKHEGYVLRVANSFSYSDFHKSVMKFVRDNHVQTSDFWMHGEVIPNKLVNTKSPS